VSDCQKVTILSKSLSFYLEYFCFYQTWLFNIDMKWFNICGQHYKPVVWSILDGFMLSRRHLTIQFGQNWKNWINSNRFWKNLIIATCLLHNSTPHGDCLGWDDSKNTQLCWFTPKKIVKLFKNVKNTFSSKVLKNFLNFKNLIVSKFLIFID